MFGVVFLTRPQTCSFGQGRVLLIHKNYGQRRWSLPGGVLEPGESRTCHASGDAGA